MPIEDLNRVADTQKSFLSFAFEVAKISNNPFISKGKKKKLFCEKLDALDEGAYIQNFPQILEAVQSSRKGCEQFDDSEAQVNNIMEWLPRLKDHRELVVLIIQERRKKYKLKV